MISLRFTHEPALVTCLGAHPDDIEIGAGGTLLHLAAAHPATRFRFLVLTGSESRQAEARDSAAALLGDRVEVVLGGFEENTLPYTDPSAAKDFVHEAGGAAETEVVVAPQAGDLHQDHRFVAEVAHQAFRNHPILGYEIPKYDGDLGRPNVFVWLTELEASRKLDHLEAHFESQREKPWYTRDLFAALMRIRGVESRSQSGFAEAFSVAKAAMV